jgi:hypothetical protein
MGTNQEFCSSIELSSFELAPYIGFRDKKALIDLRLKRIKARQWMREKGFKDLGAKRCEIQRID